MAKTVIIRLTCSGGRTGPFDISAVAVTEIPSSTTTTTTTVIYYCNLSGTAVVTDSPCILQGTAACTDCTTTTTSSTTSTTSTTTTLTPPW